MELLVDAEWLNKHRGDPKLKIVEASWKEDGYERAHIDGALRLPCHSYLKREMDDGSRSPYLITADDCRRVATQLGLNRDDRVVVYDEYHGLLATRCWWVFRYYGFSGISVLNGGWQEWLEKGFPISCRMEGGDGSSDFEPSVAAERNIKLEELKELLGSDELQVWDARREAEFVGTEETSNDRDGHIPGAINLNWTDLLTEARYEGGSRKLKPVPELRRILEEHGFRKDKTIVCHCQASIRGAFASFVLELLGFPKNRVYDGAMAEWANRDDTPLRAEQNGSHG